MQNAHDRVKCGFLGTVMLRLVFVRKWINLINVYVSNVKYQVVVNEVKFAPFKLSRELQYGNLITPTYLF